MSEILRILAMLPPALRTAIEEQAASREGLYDAFSELRLRAGRLASITLSGENILLPVTLSASALSELLADFCGGSLYAHRSSITAGFLDLGGGVRCGIGGVAVVEDGRVVGLREPTSLVLRFPHTVKTAAEEAERIFYASGGRGLLVFSPPGVGKTTLLCDLARRLSTGKTPLRVALVDSRGELSGGEYGRTALLDILVGYPKAVGIEIATRVLAPEVLMVDEIGSHREAEAILSVAGCGVPLVATAHARSKEELLSRPAIRPLLRARLFASLVGLFREGQEVRSVSYTVPTFSPKR